MRVRKAGREVAHQLAEVHAVLRGEVQHELGAVHRVLGVHQLHLQPARRDLLGGYAP